MRDKKVRAWDKVTQTYLYSDKLPSMWQFCKELETRGIRHFETEDYTELKDKNGKEIYEGDLLHAGSWGSLGYYSENTFVVEFFEGVFGGVKVDYSERKDRLSFAAPLRKLEECEVIGNIYSNSELLEVKDGPSGK